MKQIFIGLIFIFFNFYLKFNGSSIDVLPNFIGYILIVNGLNELVRESMLFVKAKPVATVMVILTSILFITDLLGITVTLGSLNFLLQIISLFLYLYITFHIVMGVKDMEGKYSRDLNGDGLKSSWTIFAIFYALAIVLAWIPLVNLLLLIVGFIMNIIFLFSFNNSKNLYYNQYS